MMNSEDAEIIQEFVIESQEHLGDVETDFLTMETQGEDVDVDLVNRVFRAIHSIKGAAGFLGLSNLESLAHREEEVLNRIRNREIVPDESIVSSLLSATDRLKQLLCSIEDSNDMDVSSQIEELGKILSGETGEETGDSTTEEATEDSETEDAQQVDSAVEVAADEASGEVPHEPTVTEGNEETQVAEPQPVSSETETAKIETPARADAKADTVVAKKSTPANSNTENKPPAESVPSETSIRVDVGLLDSLMNQVGELVLARNQMLQFVARFDDNEYNTTSQRLNLITSELQEGVMKTRMQPIGNVWSKFPRLVRDLARTCKKEVRIEMEGKETDLDKTIIEAIKDPLTHLVRNTVDHGIEYPEQREANGKPREGCLKLRAFHEGGQVNIEISDDGAGLNTEKILTKALEKRLITEEQANSMQDQEICNLIFAPGFSTADQISNVSGRGVGMDVVKTNIEGIGGTLDLESRPGRGTTIRIKIPLTLAIIPALLIRCDSNRFAIPQINLVELVQLEDEDSESKIEWIQNAPVYRLRGKLLPLVDLRRILNQEDRTEEETDGVNIVVLRADDEQFGLIVDFINDTEEIVVKPLSEQIKDVSVYSGATILGDGSVALILDVLAMAQRGKIIRSGAAAERSDSDEDVQCKKGAVQNLLILEVSDGRCVAMPMSQVARLEKIPERLLEIANGKNVIQYRGKILPLVDLRSALGIPESPPQMESTDIESDLDEDEIDEPTISVVVYTEGEQSVGLVVQRILDIVETSIDLVESTQGNGVRGSAIIRDTVIDLIDLPIITRNHMSGVALA